MRKKRKHNEEEFHERWLVSYADFITLLFAFFVIMYATSQKDLDKQEDFQKSIKKYLLKVSSTAVGGASGGASGAKNFHQKDSMISTPIKSFRKVSPTNSLETINTKKSVEKNIQENIDRKAIAKYIRDIAGQKEGVLISLYSRAIFAENSSKIYSSSSVFLDQMGDIVSKFKGPIRVLGHSSKNNLKRTKYSSEWEFSSDRAIKILRYLSKRFGIKSSRLVSSAYGDSQPLFNNTKEGNYKNNRVDILLVTQ